MAWYCNSDCQKKHWLIHLVDCNPGRPITTADRLVAFIHGRTLPNDETRRDFGFTQTSSFESRRMMFSVYDMLIVGLQVKADTIYQWMEKGILGAMMQETFDTRLSTEELQHPVYNWFRKHQSKFSRDADPDRASETVPILKAFLDACKYTGRDPKGSKEVVENVLLQLTADQDVCFQLVAMVYAHKRPTPLQSYGSAVPHPWVHYGFCACENPIVEEYLAAGYRKLIPLIDWDTLCHAYITSSIPKLFADHNMAINHPLILDVLNSRNYKSVWYLRAFVVAEDDLARKSRAPPAIGVDYGFVNCQNVDEVIVLRNAYKQVLMRTDADPLALHEACIRGGLFQHVRQMARLKPPQLFKRLMKNPYPLEVYGVPRPMCAVGNTTVDDYESLD